MKESEQASNKEKPQIRDKRAVGELAKLARECGMKMGGAKVRRTSSRFCWGVEHGDYNGTELFGVGTDRFIWMGYKPNQEGRMRLMSGNFPEDGMIEYRVGEVPEAKSATIAHTWGRFAWGVNYILGREGIKIRQGMDAVIWGNIPGGGMSRSASLTLNLILSLLEVNGIAGFNPLQIVDWAQAVENDYIGSPCGILDQTIILFAQAGMGTHYNPKTRQIKYVPLGKSDRDFQIVLMDSGTVRPGLEKSTYKTRRQECQALVEMLQKDGWPLSNLADVREAEMYEIIMTQYGIRYGPWCSRLKYIYEAQKRFYLMLEAWKQGDVDTLGRIFRADGLGLRDDYQISGPELETMCDIARTVPGVLGERMLGGGDKGAAGAIVRAEAVEHLKQAIAQGYPASRPEYADKYAVHECSMVAGVTVFEGMI